mgnify:CR=1 FL=1
MLFMHDPGLAASTAGSGKRSGRVWQWMLVTLGVATLISGAVYTYVDQSRTSGIYHPLTLRITGIRNDAGVVRAAVCNAREQFPIGCTLAAESRASMGVVLVQFPRVETGAYAVAVFHDENQNGQLDMHQGRQVPSEGVAFSNDAFARAGVPSFEQARFDFDGNEQRLRVQYMR